MIISDKLNYTMLGISAGLCVSNRVYDDACCLASLQALSMQK